MIKTVQISYKWDSKELEDSIYNIASHYDAETGDTGEGLGYKDVEFYFMDDDLAEGFTNHLKKLYPDNELVQVYNLCLDDED